MTADEFNEQYSVGTRVKYHPIIGREAGIETKTRSEAWALRPDVHLVLVEGKAGGVSLEAITIPKVMSKVKETPENYVMSFLKAIYPEYTEVIMMAATEERVLRDATNKINRLTTREKELEKRDAILSKLEAAGVDNWAGYDDALEGE